VSTHEAIKEELDNQDLMSRQCKDIARCFSNRHSYKELDYARLDAGFY